MACVAYMPLSKLQESSYRDLAQPSLHFDLEPLFAKEYCASLGMSRQLPLRVVGDIGGGGALARIEKGKKVMRERRSEWSQSDELPVSPTHTPLKKLIFMPLIDRNSAPTGKQISLHFCVFSFKRTINGT